MLQRIDVISLFPEMFAALQYGITGRAIRNGLIDLEITNPRDFTHDKHRTVDDRPYGGGPGMLMKVEPLKEALHSIKTKEKTKVVYLSPQGQPLTQNIVKELSNNEQLILLAGRYEGVDERLIEHYIDYECSIGDYVLSGGELPAMVLIDSLIRLLPEALGHNESAVEDSFYSGLLDHPHYTRPETLVIDGNNENVPPVLLSGDHKKIAQWRKKQSLGRTWQRRPDLLQQRQLTEQEQKLLQMFIQEQS